LRTIAVTLQEAVAPSIGFLEGAATMDGQL
jgi:hypothetical protein